MAVQVVAYELWLAAREPRGGSGDVAAGPHACAQEMERFYEQLAQVLDEIDFRDRTRSGQLMARLRRFFNRAAPDQNEIQHTARNSDRRAGSPAPRAGEPHGRRPPPARDGDDLPRQRRDHAGRSTRGRGNAGLHGPGSGFRQRVFGQPRTRASCQRADRGGTLGRCRARRGLLPNRSCGLRAPPRRTTSRSSARRGFIARRARTSSPRVPSIRRCSIHAAVSSAKDSR